MGDTVIDFLLLSETMEASDQVLRTVNFWSSCLHHILTEANNTKIYFHYI